MRVIHYILNRVIDNIACSIDASFNYNKLLLTILVKAIHTNKFTKRSTLIFASVTAIKITNILQKIDWLTASRHNHQKEAIIVPRNKIEWPSPHTYDSMTAACNRLFVNKIVNSQFKSWKLMNKDHGMQTCKLKMTNT